MEFSKKQLDVLKDFGLTKSQSLLYLTSLKQGPLSVLELSKLTNINRQQIYDDAGKLVALGLYEPTSRQKRRYIAARPKKLLEVGEKKIGQVEDTLAALSPLLPQLEALSSPKKYRIISRYYEGLPRIRDAYEEELRASKGAEVLSFAGSIDDVFEFFPESYWETWNKKFVRQRSSSRMLVHQSDAARATAQNDARYKRETRWLGHFPLKINMDVFGDVVLIVSFYDETAIWIESKMLAQSYRILFNSLWGNAKNF